MPEGLNFKLTTGALEWQLREHPQLGSAQSGLQSNYFQHSARTQFSSIYRVRRVGVKFIELFIQGLTSASMSQQMSYWDFGSEIIAVFQLPSI